MALALLVAGTFFMENLDSTVITPALPAMAASFAAPPVALNVGVSAYMLTLGVFIPVSGWVAERFGARGVFTTAIAVFTISSLLCGLAPSLPVFVLTRILQGIGGALMVPVGRLVVLRATPKDRLTGAIATLTWPALAALVLGPPLGGLIVDRANWRWIFYLNLPLGLIALAIAWRVVPKSGLKRIVPFDWPGFLLIGSGLFFLMALAEILAEPDGVWLLAVAAAALGAGLLGFGVRRLRTAPHPMIDIAALKIPTFAVAIWGGSLFRMGISAVPFLLPVMFQIGFGYSPFEAGALLMAVFAGNLLPAGAAVERAPQRPPHRGLRRFHDRNAPLARLPRPVRRRPRALDAVHRAQHDRLRRRRRFRHGERQHDLLDQFPARDGTGRRARRDRVAHRRGALAIGRPGDAVPHRLRDRRLRRPDRACRRAQARARGWSACRGKDGVTRPLRAGSGEREEAGRLAVSPPNRRERRNPLQAGRGGVGTARGVGAALAWRVR
jgi:MFS family permease